MTSISCAISYFLSSFCYCENVRLCIFQIPYASISSFPFTFRFKKCVKNDAIISELWIFLWSEWWRWVEKYTDSILKKTAWKWKSIVSCIIKNVEKRRCFAAILCQLDVYNLLRYVLHQFQLVHCALSTHIYAMHNAHALIFGLSSWIPW